MTRSSRAILVLAAMLGAASTAFAADCRQGASDACFFDLQVQGQGAPGTLHYYASFEPGKGSPTSALVAVHGHPHDANKTFDAALLAMRRADALDRTVVVAPLFQVDPAKAAKCRTAGVPAARTGDLLWTCSSWMEGGPSEGVTGIGSFAAMDALVAELHHRWPSLKTVTIAGFSAGGQMVQHAIGFAQDAPPGVSLRYVVSDPGTWLYFDPGRPEGNASECAGTNRWKYGTDGLPPDLGRSAADARARYAAADVHYMEGALDSSDGPGTASRVLDRSCAAMAQGSYRLQRGQGYVAYDRTVLAPRAQRQLTVVPGCAHDVACVFPSDPARAVLTGVP